MTRTEELRSISGSVSSCSPLVSFLYLLMRDHLPAGEIEKLVQECNSSETIFTNGWLAEYSKNLADILVGPLNEECSTSSGVVIETDESMLEDMLDNVKKEQLEQVVAEMVKDEKFKQIEDQLMERFKPIPDPNIIQTTKENADKAMELVRKMQEQGKLGAEKVEEIEKDLEIALNNSTNSV